MKILLMIQNVYSYGDKIIEELEKQGHNVEIFDISLSKYERARKIKNPFIRIYNDRYLKKYKGINLKDELEGKEILKDLYKIDKKYDIFLKIGCVWLAENVLKYLKEKVPLLISHHWDSSIRMDRCKIDLEKKYFNKVSSFDKEDVKRYNLFYLPNFYMRESKNIETEYDIYTIMSGVKTKRKEILEKIADECLKNKISYSLNLVDETIEEESRNKINIIKCGISLEEMLVKEEKSKAIIEILHHLNTGCTFRTFDCIGMSKKLITNNQNIMNEDFYNPNNILVIDENNIKIPKEFIETPYEDLPKEIFKKYSLKNWIKQLLKIEESEL